MVDGFKEGERVEQLIRAGKAEEFRPLLVSYIKRASRPDVDLLIDLAFRSADPYVVSEVIQCLGYRRHDSAVYRELVWYGLRWPHDDVFDEVILASLARLPAYFAKDPLVRTALKSHLGHSNPVVRDALAEVAQELMGVPANQVFRTKGTGDLFEVLDPKFWNWVSSD